ncbi:MAG: hypothetical protein KKA06_07620, partial [Nanoarchaeota archaeon]|nr:hypothetical protein [Nanoarchaeota archaeon]
MIINFEKISWQQILTLIRVINSCPSLNLKTVTRWYNSESTNFEDTLKFLKNIRVVKLKGDKIIPREALNHTIGLNNESIKQFFIDTLFRKRNYL